MSDPVREVSEVSPLGAYQSCGIDCFFDGEVSRVRPSPPECVEDEYPDPSELIGHLIGYLCRIGYVTEFTDTETVDLDIPMWDGEGGDLEARNLEGAPIVEGLELYLGLRCPGEGQVVGVEDIVELSAQDLGGCGVGEGWEWSIASYGEGAEIIDPMDMIGVAVGEPDGIDPRYTRSDELESELGGCVDEEAVLPVITLEECAVPRPPISGIGRGTGRTIAADDGYTE